MVILRMDLRPAIFAALIMILTSVAGCASLVEKGELPEVVARRPPNIQLGGELILLEESPLMSCSLIDKGGTAHVFVVDEEGKLNHIEIFGEKIITRESIGIIETKQRQFLDAVEHPPGKLRVLAGDKQYFQVSPNLEWQEVTENRCARFVPVGDDLFCAFVIKGDEISAPERTDYTYGMFLLVPFVFWSHEHASKLVLAQESEDGWIVRAVVDPDIPMDADSDFMVETDSFGNIHFLYFTSRGGGTFIFLFIGYGVIDEAIRPEPELRYAQLTLDQLQAHSNGEQNRASSNTSTPMKWITVNGTHVPPEPFIKMNIPFTNMVVDKIDRSQIDLRPLNRKFSFNKQTGEVDGLMWARQCALDDGERRLLVGWDDLLVEASIRDGQWLRRYNVVVAKDFPASNYSWTPRKHLLLRTDSRGDKHLLLKNSEKEFWKTRSYVNYLVKDDVNWSVPLRLGSSSWSHNCTLAVDDSGAAFAAWVNEEDKFVGKWIKPLRGDTQ